MSALQVMHVLRAGFATTAQDLGVRGRAHLGVSLGGAFDRRSLALANRAVGNAADTMGLEVLLQGPRMQARAPCLVAWCGAPFDVDIDGVALPALTARSLAPGQLLRVGRCAVGARCAVAFAGGLNAARGDVLQRDGLLALRGEAPPRPLSPSPSPSPLSPSPSPLSPSPSPWEFPSGPMVLRVTDSTHSERFSASSHTALCSASFIVSTGSDRRGIRLTGAGVSFPATGEILTEGVSLGAVQVTRGGELIILGVDQTTTGGYPRIAHVISADVWRLAHLRPGASVRFERVGFGAARALWLEEEQCA